MWDLRPNLVSKERKKNCEGQEKGEKKRKRKRKRREETKKEESSKGMDFYDFCYGTLWNFKVCMKFHAIVWVIACPQI